MQKFMLTWLTSHLRILNPARFEAACFTFRPATIIKWYRQLVTRKWRFGNQARGGRPRLSETRRDLVIRLKRENPTWGVKRIHGEVCKPGVGLSQSAVRDILRKHFGNPTVPDRGLSWQAFINHYRSTIIACDYFTVETVFLKTWYVLFFIDLMTREITIAGVTQSPSGRWASQQARQLVWDGEWRDKQYLIHDRDGKFSEVFDNVFVSEGIQILKTPPQAPVANAYAERWVRSIRQECLDKVIILNEKHLRMVLDEYVGYYNRRRPHQGIGQRGLSSSPQFPLRFGWMGRFKGR
jgi:transposase InsO family protein